MAAAVWTRAVVEQQAVGAAVWTTCAPSLEDFGQANVGTPLGAESLLLLGRNRGYMTKFGEEDRDHLCASSSRSLEVHRGALT